MLQTPTPFWSVMWPFKCKCCHVLRAENEHLRKWIDRLMEQKAPEVKEDVVIDPRLVPPDEDEIFDSDGGFNDRSFRTREAEVT